MEKHYKTLELQFPATRDEVKKAFHRLAHVHHPDKGGDEGRFKEINEAYSILIKRGYWDVLSQEKAKHPEDAERPGWKPEIFFSDDGSCFWTEDIDGCVSSFHGALPSDLINEEIVYK
jgi:DnaJ-class molecular chaperone